MPDTFKSFLSEMTLFEEFLEEKLIVFNGGKKYGQIVFMAGGAASGKGFAVSKFLQAERFKVRDVDEWKTAFMKIDEIKGKYPEVRGLDLKNPDDVFKLHTFVKEKGIKEKTLDLLLRDTRADRLPNIIFDITAKDIKDITEVLPLLQEAGYEPRNIHLVWILANYKVALNSNLERSRTVPEDVLIKNHTGAAKTMVKIMQSGKMPKGMDGDFHVILNNRENTVFFEPGAKYKGRKIPPLTKVWNEKKGKYEPIRNIRDFYYINIKKAGYAFKPTLKWREELFDQIVQNIPGGADTLNDTLEKMDA